MIDSDIRFFTSEDNTAEKPLKSKVKAPQLTGYISTTGKLTFPAKTAEQLGITSEATAFRVGTDAGKRKVKTLYLVVADSSATDAFTLHKGAKSHYIELGALLKSNGLDFTTAKYSFTITPVDYQDGGAAYALTLKVDSANEPAQPKAPYMGKPRGRKKKEEAVL